MTTKGLPIEGFDHMTLTAQGDQAILERTLTALRAAGFTIETDRIVPPAGATGPQVIAAVSSAFQAAKHSRAK